MSRFTSARRGFGRAPLVIGHRGVRGPDKPPENTLEAFEAARSEGATAVELDVRLARGGEAVVFHDATLERLTLSRDPRPIEQLSVRELAQLDLGGGARIPTLIQVLDWARSRDVSVNIELKHDVSNILLLARAATGSTKVARADVLYSSFDVRLLAAVAGLGSKDPRALLTYAAQPRWARAIASAARPPWVFALHVETPQATPGHLARCARLGLRVGVWTCNDGASARALAAQGVAFIITDAPGRMIHALRPVTGNPPA